MRIFAGLVDTVPFGVDTPDDLERARRILAPYPGLEARHMTSNPEKTIAFQGVLGANSHMACHSVYPDMTPLSCAAFEDAFAAVSDGQARYAMIPVENSVMGRVADIHHILPESGLNIVA